MDGLVIISTTFSGLAVSLMVLVLKNNIKNNGRLQKIESDLYVDPHNPTSMPLTKQVSNMNKQVIELKGTCEGYNGRFEKLDKTMTKVKNMVIAIHDGFNNNQKEKK